MRPTSTLLNSLDTDQSLKTTVTKKLRNYLPARMAPAKAKFALQGLEESLILSLRKRKIMIKHNTSVNISCRYYQADLLLPAKTG